MLTVCFRFCSKWSLVVLSFVTLSEWLSNVTSQQEGPGSYPVCVEFACSPCACVVFSTHFGGYRGWMDGWMDEWKQCLNTLTPW